MVEMNRLRIFKENGWFFIRRKVRNDWLDVLDEEGNPVKSETYEEAVELLNLYINR